MHFWAAGLYLMYISVPGSIIERGSTEWANWQISPRILLWNQQEFQQSFLSSPPAWMRSWHAWTCCACGCLRQCWNLLGGFVGAQEHPRGSRFLSLWLLAVLAVMQAPGPSEHLTSVWFLGKHTWLCSWNLNTSLSNICPTSCCLIL